MDFILIEKENVDLQKAETQTQKKCNLADKSIYRLLSSEFGCFLRQV